MASERRSYNLAVRGDSRGDLLRVLDRAPILQIRRNARCPERVAPDPLVDPRVGGSPLDHAVRVPPRHGTVAAASVPVYHCAM